MAVPSFSMRELIDAGVHFGHKTKRWNPRMAPFIYGARNDVHIIDLQKTVPMLHNGLQAVRKTIAGNGRVLFVGTKRQASEVIADAAKRCGQYYVNSRWLGGMLTNWKTIQNSIRQLKSIEETIEHGDSGLTKKELLNLQRQRDKLERSLGGIRDMGGLPDLMFVIDTNREDLAVKEAQKLGIPIVAIIDTNCSAEGIDFPIPGNDDATRAIKLYCKLISDAVLGGIQESIGDIEEDFGAKAEPKELAQQSAAPVEEAPAKEEAKADTADKKPAKKKVASSTKKEAFAKEAKKAATARKPKAEASSDKEGDKAEAKQAEEVA